MNVLEQIALAWQSLRLNVGLLVRPRLWSPWLVLAAVQFAALGAMWGFAHPWLSPWVAPLLVRTAGERVLHYPDFFGMLPALYARADVAVAAVLGSVVQGAATSMFADVFHGGVARVGRAWSIALRRAVPLVLANLPFNLLVAAFAFAVSAVTESRSGLVQRAAYLVILGGTVFIQSLFLYVTALMVVEGRSVWDAWKRLYGTWKSGLASAFVLGLLLLLPLLPLNLLSGQAGRIVARGQPELVGVMMFLQIGVALVTGFLLYGGATLIFLSSVTAPRREPAA